MNLFGKKASSFEKRFGAFYNGLQHEREPLFLPNGKEQLSIIFRSLAIICDANLDTCNLEKYDDFLRIYIDIWARRKVLTSTEENEERAIASLLWKHNSLNRDTALKAYHFCNLNCDNPQFSLLRTEDFETFEFVNQSKDADELSNEKEKYSGNIDAKDYGLSPENPVHVSDRNRFQQFLGRLKTVFGEELLWEDADVLQENADAANKCYAYNGILPSGRRYKTVYIATSGNSVTRIPSGFIDAGVDSTGINPISRKSKRAEFYFENFLEFNAYCYNHPDYAVTWLGNDKYVGLYQKVYALVGAKKYKKAIEIAKEAIECNPVATVIRLELINCYTATGEVNNALHELQIVAPYVCDDNTMYAYYRKAGYIMCEMKKYDVAYLCYRMGKGNDNKTAIDEMQWIIKQIGRVPDQPANAQDGLRMLSANNIPIVQRQVN